MKYPLDPLTYVETIGSIVEHEKTQTAIILRMGELLESAMDASETDEELWYRESETLIKELNSLRMYHDSRRFNDANYQAQQPKERGGPIISSLSNDDEPQFDSGGGELSEEDLAKHFKEKRKGKKEKEKAKTLDKMSLEEIESWEKQQDNSNDLYKIKARVANLARGPGVSLTPQGEMLCNTYVHVLKALYDFADKIEDKDVKIQLTQLVRSQEGMPGTLIAAAGVGVKMKKDEKNKPV